MSKEMKIIMENFRRAVLEVAEPIETYGDLRNQLKTAINSKKKEALKGFGIGLVFDALGGAIFKDTATFIKTMYKLPDDKKTNTVLDVFLNVDDDVSAIVDDNIENSFLQDFLQIIKDKQEDERITSNITQELQDYIAKEFNQRTVKGS
jgi:flagellar motor component MotA|tara:strand:+ start:70 stop:516 length:447 start_codon:yes stop_codon:yes gene_type:complete